MQTSSSRKKWRTARKKSGCEEGHKKIGIARSLVILFSQILINLLEWNGSIFGRAGITYIFVILQFSTIVLHWRRVEGVVAVVGRGQGICKFGWDVYNFWSFFVVAIFDEKFARKDGCGWAEEEEEPFPREFGLIPPIKSFSRPPRSFLNLLVSVSEVYRGDEDFLHRRKQKTKNRTHP